MTYYGGQLNIHKFCIFTYLRWNTVDLYNTFLSFLCGPHGQRASRADDNGVVSAAAVGRLSQ